MYKQCLFTVFALFSITTALESSQKDNMISDLESIRQTFDVEYAPADWKKNHTGWSLETEINKAKDKVINFDNPSPQNFHEIAKGFFNSTNDYHVGITFFSTATAALPFDVRSADGRYFISWVNRSALPVDTYPFQIGDEILSFDGKPIDDVIKGLKGSIQKSNDATDQAYAEILLTRRIGALGIKVPKGHLLVKILHKGKVKANNYQMVWKYFPEKIKQNMSGSKELAYKTNPKDPLAKFKKNPITMMNPEHALFVKNLHENDEESEDSDVSESDDRISLGSNTTFVPPLGEIIWQNESLYFPAYIYINEAGKQIGVLRIPNYRPAFDEENILRSVSDFKEQIAILEKYTDALVIDQVNNPGGYVFYLYALASFLTDDLLFVPKHRFAFPNMIIEECLQIAAMADILKYVSDVEFPGNMQGMPMNSQVCYSWIEFAETLVDQWNEGRRLSDPLHFVVDTIHPNPEVHYTKPIVVLVNSLDISGGDFFPAILQDNKRAVIFGTNTAGAGGAVNSVSFPNHFKIREYHYTITIGERLNGKPIENLGVTPDVQYVETVDDLQNGYEGYKKAVNDVVSDILK